MFRRVWLAGCVWLVLVGTAFASGPTVGPRACQLSWQQAAPGADTRATGWYVYLRQGASYSTPFRTIPAPVKPQTQAQQITVDCRAWALSDGQWYAVIRAYNANGESDPSNEAPFSWLTNQAEPSLDAPTGTYLGP